MQTDLDRNPVVHKRPAEKMMSRILLWLVSIATICNCALSSILHVPGNYPTIQAAILGASEGDTVLVDPGTYFENLNFKGKNILVSSLYLLGSDTSFIFRTVINGGAPLHPDTGSCVLFISHETSAATLEGFTLTGGTGTRWPDSHIGGFYREGGGILTENSSPTIRYNRITGNQAVDLTGVTSAGGGAIRSDGGTPLILNNVIMNNTGRYGAGIVLNYTGAIIRNNVIAKNSGGQDFGGSGIWANQNGATPKIVENNTIVDNASSLDGGGVLVWSTSVTLRSNIIWGNTAPAGPEIRLRGTGSATVSYCDVQGGWPGSANIDADPHLACLGYYLLDGSPCIDQGDNTGVSAFDPAQSGNPDSAAWPSKGLTSNDMGAYGGPDRAILGLNGNFGPPLLVSPPDNEGGLGSSIMLSWHEPECAGPFELQVSTDSTFAAGMIVDDSTISDTVRFVAGLQEFKTYFWRVHSVRSIYGDGWSPVWKFTVAAFGFSVPVSRGWNLISLAVRSSDSSLPAVFPTASSRLFTYVPDSGYVEKTVFARGTGYWLEFPDSQEIVVNGLPTGGDTVQLNPGWNMIGSVSAGHSAASVTTDPPGILASPFWTYDRGYVHADSIKPFGGYWVKASQSGQLVLDSAGPAAGKIAAVDRSLEGLHSLSFRDAEGNSQTLYYAGCSSRAIPAEWYELPPLPAGTFDVRFASGRLAEPLKENTLVPIRVTCSRYPAAIRWDSGSPGISLIVDEKIIPLNQPGEASIPSPGSTVSLRATGASASPEKFVLLQNYPNPFNPSTSIRYQLPVGGERSGASLYNVRLKIYNILGEAVATLVDGLQAPGFKSIAFDAGKFPGGIYYCRLTAGQFSEVKAMILMR